ncbi:MAG: mevalonate kinase [Candidatus Poseidoniaceae archaeon]|nr:mevalonate kinase [Candidatus Poseidoniaceae archaeon]
MEFVTASAPGKCILFGEHAVVYGHPAVAVAIDQRISVKIQPSPNNLWLLDGSSLNMNRNPHIKGLIEKLWPQKDGAPALSIHIKGNIPRASGLGSSAALSVATAAALRMARGRWVSKTGGTQQQYWLEGFGSTISKSEPYDNSPGSFALELPAEKYHIIGKSSVDSDECAILAHGVEAAAQQGRASPMDSSTCSHGGRIIISDVIEQGVDYLYQRTLAMADATRQWHIHEMTPPNKAEDIFLVIGNTGIHAPTGKQVAKVADMLQQDPSRMKEIDTIGQIARRGIEALKEGDFAKVGRTMTENQLMLSSIGVSSPELDNLIKAASPSSLGAKLTGAGGGGCMVALTKKPKETSDAIELAGGRTLISRLGSTGLSIDDSQNAPFWTKA